MKILHVVKIFPKISETFVLDLITRLIKKGYPALILSVYRQTIGSQNLESTVHKDIFTYNLLQKTYYCDDVIKESGERILFDQKFEEVLRDVDIIVSHFADLPAEISMKISASYNKPFISFAHARDIFVDPDINKLKRLLEMAKKVIVPTEYNKKYLLNMLGSDYKEKINILHCGIDVEVFSPLREILPPQKEVIICSIGRLISKKGFEFTIKAFSAVHRKYPYTKLKIIGGGDLRDDLLRLTENLGIKNNVDFLGYVDHAQIPLELQNSNIFVLHCIKSRNGNQEGLPIAILEAMSMELPVISTYHTGIPEVISDGVNGFLTNEEDLNDLINKLDFLIGNPSIRTAMGKKGRERILAEFNSQFITDKLVILLREVL